MLRRGFGGENGAWAGILLVKKGRRQVAFILAVYFTCHSLSDSGSYIAQLLRCR